MRRRQQAWVLGVAAVVLATAGCTGSSAGPTPTSSAASPPTGSKSPAVKPSASPPSLPMAAAKQTPEGASAFVGYFWDVVDYSYQSRSSATLRALSSETCKFCSQVADEIDKRKSENAHFEGYEVTVVAAVTAPGNPLAGLITNAMLSVTAGRTVGADGATLEAFPSNPHLGCEVGVAWNGRQWRVLGVVIDPKRTP